ncbi:MAG: hypothetical protein LBU73_02555 [Helicobacteraceae bacterium]|nr:hypothetical protein [Helicobacteraceae bacterium]
MLGFSMLSTAQHSTAQHSTAQHGTARQRGAVVVLYAFLTIFIALFTT